MKKIDLNWLNDSDLKLLKNWIKLQEEIEKGDTIDFNHEVISTLRDDLYGRFILHKTQYRNELVLTIFGKASKFDDFGKKHGWIQLMNLSVVKPQFVYVTRVLEKVKYTRYLKLLAEFVAVKGSAGNPAAFRKVPTDTVPAYHLRKTADFHDLTASEKRQLGHFEGIFQQFKNVDFYENADDDCATFQKVELQLADMTLAECDKRYQALKGMQFSRELIGDCEFNHKAYSAPTCDFCGSRDGGGEMDATLYKVWGFSGSAIACDTCLGGILKGRYDDGALFVKDGDSYYFATDKRLENKKFHTRGLPKRAGCFHH